MEIIARFKSWLRRNRESENSVIRYGIRVFDACVSFAPSEQFSPTGMPDRFGI